MYCRHCNNIVSHTFLDLGSSPPSNSYLTKEKLSSPEKWFPLRVLVCENCYLVQTEDFTEADELFDSDYAYFSSYSKSWLKHAQSFSESMVERFHLNSKSIVIEVAANDGYLLQYFQKSGIPNIGIEPTKSTANSAREKGLNIIEEFFGTKLSKELIAKGIKANLTVANNVLAHVPNINDFVSAFSIILDDTGVASFEFPHLINLIEQNQFDTIYHEHFSYLSLTVVNSIFEKNGLSIFKVEKINTHGGSLRVFAQKQEKKFHLIDESVNDILTEEINKGVITMSYYSNFQEKVNSIKNNLLNYLIELKNSGKIVAGYGAAAKGNTIINYSGIKKDLINFIVDKNPVKQNKFMPGSRIPIVDEEFLKKTKPDIVLILPWNLKNEITQQLSYIRDWNAKFLIAVPILEEF